MADKKSALTSLPRLYREWAELREELDKLTQKNGHFPRLIELRQMGRRDLAHAIGNRHAGMNEVRKRYSGEKERELIAKVRKRGDAEAKGDFKQWHFLVDQKTWKKRKRPDYSEVRVHAAAGLLRAIACKDMYRKSEFRKEAGHAIEQSVRQYIQRQRRQ